MQSVRAELANPRCVIAHPRRTWSGLAAALVVGALPALAFPAPSWWWLAWFGIVPLLLVVRAAPTARAAALRACCGMAGYILATQYWLLPSAGPLLIVLAIGLGALWLPWGLAAYLLLREPITARGTLEAMVVLPSAWVVAEAVRSWPSLGGPWAMLGASQWNQPATLASASLGGVWFTSFLIIGANTAIAGVILHRRVSVCVIAAAVAVACAGLGPAWFWLGPAPPAGSTVRVALVQPGNLEDSVARQAAGEALTAALAGRRLDLVVWGESSVGVDLTSQPEAMTRLADLSRRVGADLLVNVDARRSHGRNLQVVGPDRTERIARRLLEDAAGAIRRVRAAAAAARLGHPAHQGGGRGPTTRQWTSRVAHRTAGGKRPGNAYRRARHRTADQFRDNLLRPSPPGGATRRAAAGVSEFHLDVPGNLGAAAVGQPGRGTRRGGGPPGGAHRFVRRQRCLRRTRAGNSPGTPPPNAARSW